MAVQEGPKIPPQEFLDTAVRIVEEAHEKGIVLRVIGAIAVMLHTKELSSLHGIMDRRLTDIDFVAYGKNRKPLIELLESHGYILDKRRAASHIERYIFESARFHIDVFFDKISMCHEIDFRNRLEAAYPTIPLAELVLEKMQIHDINEKDLKDTAIVILAHKIGESDEDVINIRYISQQLSDDWGFYYSVTENLKLLRDGFLDKFNFLSDVQKSEIREKIGIMVDHIDSEKKSMKWKLRARVGPSKKWYVEVEQVQR